MRRKLLVALLLFILAILVTPDLSRQLGIRSGYCVSAALFQLLSIGAFITWGGASLIPWFTVFAKEALLLSSLCGIVGEHFFVQAMRSPAPSSYESWHQNRQYLSRIPASTEEGERLLQFLERRWLAKANGFMAPMIDWVYPSFGIHLQIHPDTTSCYSRNPSFKLPKTYIKLAEAWKASLPDPKSFPFFLTRCFSLSDYLPNYINLQSMQDLQVILKTVEVQSKDPSFKLIIDCTPLFKNQSLSLWDSYQTELTEACKECGFSPQQLLCIQRVGEDEVGGIRLLPLKECSEKQIQAQERFLLERLGRFGFSANYIEWDRALSLFNHSATHKAPNNSVALPSIETFIADLEILAKSNQQLMVGATLELLKGLFSSLSQDSFEKALECPTKRAVVSFALSSIKEKLQSLKPTHSFHEITSSLEEVHSHLSTLLEVFRPFTPEDFATIYRERVALPERLQHLTSCTLHVSAMTALGGIIKAVEKTVGHFPHILYGDNSYFECIEAAETLGFAKPMEEASEQEIQEADLLLVQFNPVLKRGERSIDEYRIEKISETLRKCLDVRQGKPLTVALDSTIDFIHSSREYELLSAFAEEIEKGTLNIISYRSGSKLDLFGMDNYCGGALYMIHNRDSYWEAFSTLLTDPLLQTDLLSLNWFCLAYRYAAVQLDLYRKQIFDNTRVLFTKLSEEILCNSSYPYRVVPFANDADPAYLEIRVAGPFHRIKAQMLVGVSLMVNCLAEKEPIFTRPAFGFYHPNFTIIFGKKSSRVRLTLGLDPQQIEVLAKALNSLPRK